MSDRAWPEHSRATTICCMTEASRSYRGLLRRYGDHVPNRPEGEQVRPVGYFATHAAAAPLMWDEAPTEHCRIHPD